MRSFHAPLLPPDSPPLPEPRRFSASDGYELGYRLWLPEVPPSGLMVALHGIQSHSGWYGYSSKRLAQAGYAVAYLDRRGSGVNHLDRGDAPHHDRLINDVVQFTQHLTSNGFHDLPRVLSAISWGGKLAATVAVQRPELFSSLILVTPGICARVRANFVQKSALRFAISLGATQRHVPIPLNDPALFTSSALHQQFIRDDPLTLRRVTLRFLAANTALDAHLRSRERQTDCRTLVLLAGRDRIVENEATRAFIRRFCPSEATIIEYPTAVHTLEFEEDRDRSISDMLDWLDSEIA